VVGRATDDESTRYYAVANAKVKHLRTNAIAAMTPVLAQAATPIQPVQPVQPQPPAGNRPNQESIKPQPLTRDARPRKYHAWLSVWDAYYDVAGIGALSIRAQQQWIMFCIDSLLQSAIRAQTYPDTPVPRQQPADPDDPEPRSILLLIEKAFLQIHPQSSRRLDCLREMHKPNEPFDEWTLAYLDRLHECKFLYMSRDELAAFLLISKCNDQRLREKLTDLNVDSVEEVVRISAKWQKSKVTNAKYNGATKANATRAKEQQAQPQGPNQLPPAGLPPTM